MPYIERRTGVADAVRVILLMVAGAAVIGTVCAQRADVQSRQLVPSSVYGPDLFQFYCASCHGIDGRGGGPVVPALKHRVPDLTMMASREGGVFPKARVTAIITGDQAPAIPAHGSKDMPVWGPIFRALDSDTTRNKARIENLVAYLETLQVRDGAKP